MTMNQFNMTENGCSLEDCHTNLFALTDLTGIKWQRLSAQTDACIVDPTEDPVLISYSKCIQSDILCVWRRQPRTDKPPDQMLSNPKELWIFWYGQDPPANLSSLISTELVEAESGSWENGLTYECRTLLFKALHNLIERCLLSHNFVRVGKWFVQPCSQQLGGRCETRANLSISFLFFLHGESTVCASIDVREHPPLYSLHASHVTAASQYSQGVQVLLAPFGMSGSLTGRSFAESDQRAQKMVEDWKRFFCFPRTENQCSEEGKELPAAVEVIIAGTKLCYPSSFVFLTGDTLDVLSRNHSSLCEGGLVAPDGSCGAAAQASSYSSSSTYPGPIPDLNAKAKSSTGQAGKLLAKTEVISKKVLAQRVIEKAWQDSTLTSGLVSNSRPQTDSLDPVGSSSGIKEESSSSVVWNFAEPMQKNSCICAKTKSMKMKAGTGGLLNKQQTSFLSGGRPGKGEKSEKADKERPRHLQRSFAPYHRRSVCHDVEGSALEMDFALPQNLASNSLKLSVSTTTEPSLQFSRSSGTSSGCQGIAVDSPHSGVPSPLISSHTQPSVNQNCDPTMPTLSPHPLPSKTERDASQSTRVKDCQDLNASCGSSSALSSAVQSMVDYDAMKGLPSSANEKLSLEKQILVAGGSVTADGCGDLEDQTAKLSLGARQMKKEAFKTWQEDQAEKLVKFVVLKRPNLPLLFEDEDAEETKAGSRFYDYPPDSIMDQPCKRMRSTDHLDNPSSSESPVDAFSHDKMVMSAVITRSSSSHLFGRPGMRGGDLPSPSMHGAPMNEDPYQFSDELDSNVKNMNLHAVRVASRDEGFPTKPTTFRQDDQYRTRGADGNYDSDEYRISMEFSPSPTSKGEQTVKLMTDDDLKPKIQDLEKMFDTDEECDTDSPPSPNHPEKPNGDMIPCSVFKISPSLGITGSSIYPVIQGPTSKDLSRMFPTPPSADNPSSEPMQDADFITETGYLLSSSDPSSHQHLYTNSYLVPKEEAVKHAAAASAANIRKECPFVYKVPALSVFPTATIYDPIDLPSNHAEPIASASHLFYSSSYQPQHSSDKLNQPVSNQYLNRHTFKSVPSVCGYPGSRNPGASVDSSPAMLGPPITQQRTPRTPMSYESPASTSSSCFNKNLSSMDNAHSIDGQTPEVNSLTVNILLTDSILNVFKDLNFDSCTICVCNTNIDGNDVGLYLPGRQKEELYRCYCAFSAIINRRHGLNSGLFYEDEVDITGYRHGYLDTRKRSLLQSPVTMSSGDHSGDTNGKNPQASVARDDVEHISQDIMMLLKDQFSTLYPSCAVLNNYQSPPSPSELTPPVPEWGSLEFVDGQDACCAALEFSRLMTADICNQSHIDKNSPCLHRWPYVQSLAKISTNSQDIVRLLKSLQPLLQDALQKKRTTKLWESVYNISGPLSWKDFHLMAGRGSEETSEPKPVPHILVGFGKEWMALSPHAIRYWDKLMLEPYSEPRNVLYVIVSPDNDYVLSQAAVFVRELGVMYEQCRMGEHKPLTEKLRDGVLRIGKTNAERVASEPVDDWFRDIGNSQTAAQLRLYSQVCRRLLANLISQHLPEKSAASDEASSRNAQYQHFQQQQQQQHQPQPEVSSFQTTSSSSLPSSLSSGGVPSASGAGPGDHHLQGSLFDAPPEGCFSQQQQQDSEADHSDGGFLSGGAGGRGSNVSGEGPFVVLYLIEPFTYGQRDADLSRLAMFGILRCYHDLLRSLPEQMQRRVQLQIIPQHVLLDFDHMSGSQFLKNICFSVYANCHRVLTKSIPGRSLTGFGTAAAAEKFLQEHKSNSEVSSVQLYTPPFVLAPSPTTALPLGGDSWLEPVDRSGVLFCTYCLSEDQRWLLVSCTDNSGEMLETCCINIEVPKRRHRKKPLVARTGLLKLWDFLVGVMSNTNQPWRVVIGRFGRLGHGELQVWSTILNRKNLQLCSQQLRKICKMCGVLQSSQTPCILSACLVSMELHPSIHIMIDSVKREENQSSKCQMSTPRDASATHILVFPTSASARSHDPSVNLPENHIEFADDDILSVFNEDDIEGDMGGDIEFLFPFGPNSPKNHSAPGSPTNDGKQFGGVGMSRDHSTSLACEPDEMNIQHLLLQQPLAMGFYISTAPTGPLPKWFWSSCPERENFCPACFKAALHIHCSSVQLNQDDPLHQPHQQHHSKQSHPLDSNVTTDVLRYVLETYNQLSWLTMDPITNDRRSCLPVHILVLMQLYHGIDRYV